MKIHGFWKCTKMNNLIKSKHRKSTATLFIQLWQCCIFVRIRQRLISLSSKEFLNFITLIHFILHPPLCSWITLLSTRDILLRNEGIASALYISIHWQVFMTSFMHPSTMYVQHIQWHIVWPSKLFIVTCYHIVWNVNIFNL